MAGRMSGKVALVTGAGSGIGRASALAFAREGAQVVVADVVESGGQETVRLIRTANGDAQFVRANIANAQEVEALVQQTVATYGRLDYAHNNAGVEGELTTTAEYSEAEWDRVIGINLKGTWLCMKYEIAHMLTQGGGAIVNTASGLGLVGLATYPAYVASKHGVIGLTKTAALEYAKANLRVNALCPGVIQTPMIDRVLSKYPHLVEPLAASEPIGRLGRPEEMAEAAVWLCSDAASFVTGLAMAVDGGYLAQ
jgi:NAD(P)-dependent dehydrogenase (short-subunit alcohol dehydrogenase family)